MVERQLPKLKIAGPIPVSRSNTLYGGIIMAYSVTKHQSYGSRIINSFVGVLIGIGLIIGMSFMLFWNEGRYNPADLAVEAQEVTSLNAESLEGQLVWYKGTLSGGPMVYDTIITNANYIALNRTAEVYAWIEEEHSHTTNNTGGSSDTTYTYTHNLGWTNSPVNPTSFKDPDYRNLPLAVAAYNNAPFINTDVSTADFDIDIATLEIDGERDLTLNSSTVNDLTAQPDLSISGNYIYCKALGSTGPATPSFGDTRLSYTYIPATLEGVLLGKVEGDSIVSYSNDDAKLYRFFQVSTLEQVVAQLDSEHTSSTWMYRIIGTILMCVGFALLTGPFSTILMVLPFLGNASKFILGIISFLVGAVFSFLVIVISAILHNLIALIIALAIIILLVIIGVNKSKKKKLSKAKR